LAETVEARDVAMIKLSLIIPVRTGDSRWFERRMEIQDWVIRHEAELIVKMDNKGKWYGVKEAIMEARGKFCAVMDVDLPVSLDKIGEALGILENPKFHFHFVQGKRIVSHGPWVRRFLSWGFHWLVKRKTGVTLDTQCGFQVWRTDSTKELMPYMKLEGWVFPIFFYMMAQEMGMSTYQLPVEYCYGEGSTVRLRRDVIGMFRDLRTLAFFVPIFRTHAHTPQPLSASPIPLLA
jgi:hypothetical protein